MTRQIICRRADNGGLPDVINGCRADDFTYYDDGTTTDDLAGNVLAGQQPLEEKRTRITPRRVTLSGMALRNAFGDR